MDAKVTIVKGATLAPPIIGRITMGSVRPRADGKEGVLPTKEDHFSITTLVQKGDRSWPEHPLHKRHLADKAKLLSIPVRVPYNNLRLNLTNHFCVFGNSGADVGRTLCSGDGERARRLVGDCVESVPCPRPEGCEYGVRNRCKSFTRFYVQVEGQDDPMGVFILRTSGEHTRNYLASKLAQLHGWTGGKIAGMPLTLNIKVKSTSRSMRTPFWYADLDLREGKDLFATIKEAKAYQEQIADAGLDQDAMEEMLLAGLDNSAFADDVEDADEWISDDDLARAASQSLEQRGLRSLDRLKLTATGAIASVNPTAEESLASEATDKKAA